MQDQRGIIMTVKKQKNTSKIKKAQGKNSEEKRFNNALIAFGTLAQERVRNAQDPFATGIKVAGQIRRLAEQIEYEVRDESMALTEAGYASGDIVGVGIGVF
ncbi:MAG: hypothetical protein A4E64_01637 [Syntrophorhabdus sp. PtaU1.Bin058]|nr:MAG: hypothetical protein A4E64_01637 [Syntrophorhabdus sp. PtaU1.Bin058]